MWITLHQTQIYNPGTENPTQNNLSKLIKLTDKTSGSNFCFLSYC